ncbi:MAG: Asp23/Gls24 family envelope stress response protein [Gaiellales bacterium]
MEKGAHVLAETELGPVAITSDALAQIVGLVLAESYGVVGTAGRRPLRRLTRNRLTDGVSVKRGADGLEIDVKVVVEYGLKLAEVAATVRSRVNYEVARITGLPIASVTVHIDGARKS